MTRREQVIEALRSKPMTNAELQGLLCTHCGDVARLMAKMRHAGIVDRIGAGRGSIAVYYLVSR